MKKLIDQNFLHGLKAIVFIALIFVVSSCNQTEETVAPVQTQPDLIEALESFDEEIEYIEYAATSESNARWGYKRWKRKPTFFTLVSALNYTGLLKTVVEEKLTIFAPDDRAFRKLGLNLWNVRKIDKAALTDILLSHVVAGYVFSNELPGCSIETINGSSIGLVPVEGGGLVLQDDSEEVTNLLFTDRIALNSVFHGIDKVLDLEIPSATIAAIANAAGFNELEKALMRASNQDLLAAVLNPEANLTVFAPDDDAFFALYAYLAGVFNVDKITIEDISPEILSLVLAHHVVADRAFSFCLSQDQLVPTLNGDEIKVDLKNLSLISSGGITAELDAGMLDIKAVNGVIHPIKSVLVPQNVIVQLPS